jgi:hypothetical protein
MKELRESRLLNDRRHLMRSLKELEAGKLALLSQTDSETMKEHISVRIAEIDRILTVANAAAT